MDPATGNLIFWTCSALAWKTQNTNQNKDKWIINSCLRLKDRIWKLVVARCWRRISPPVKRKQRQNINILWSSRYEPLSRLLVLQNETETDTKHHDLLSALSYHNSTWPISISNLKYSNIITVSQQIYWPHSDWFSSNKLKNYNLSFRAVFNWFVKSNQAITLVLVLLWFKFGWVF